jgi:hypothetical protein
MILTDKQKEELDFVNFYETCEYLAQKNDRFRLIWNYGTKEHLELLVEFFKSTGTIYLGKKKE